jgi:hypothetical protein
MQAMFERDLAASTAITAEAWARRPLRFKLNELISRIWQYWL